MKRIIRKLYEAIIPFFILCCALLFLVSGCGGGGGSTSPSALPAPSTDEQKILQKVEQTPFMQEVDFSGTLQGADGKSATAVTASRKANPVTRTLSGVELLGSGGVNCCAFVKAVFELTGTLTFNDSTGAKVTEKAIDLVAEGSYELVKNSSTGEWEIVADPIDSGLVFTQGGAAPSVTGFSTTPSTLTAGSTVSAEAQTSSSDLYVTVQSKSLNFRSQLVSESAAPKNYSGSIIIASAATAGKYITVIDTLDKTLSFDLTGDPAFTNPYTGTMKAIKLSIEQPASTGGTGGTGGTTVTYTGLTIACASTSLVVGDTTSCSATAAKSDGTSVSLSPTNVTWSLSPSTSGTITVGGILTASVSGTLTLTATFSGLTSNAVTITVSASATTTAANYVQAAKNLLFQPTVTLTAMNNARTNVLNALALEPNNPDANLLGAIIDVATEWDRVVQNVLTPSTTIFPYGGYSVQKQMVSKIVAPVADSLVSALPMAKAYTLGNNPPDLIQTELETNTLPVLNGVVSKLQKVEDYIAANAGWTFSYPKDPAFPALGDNLIDARDINVLMGAAKLVRGVAYYGLAYDATSPAGYWDSTNNRIRDVNGDGTATPSEYFPPSPFGTLRSSGTTYLTNSKADIIAGLTLVRDALNNILAETTQTAGGVALTIKIVADLNQYKHYLDEALTSLSGTTTSVTIPGTTECWHTVGGTVVASYIFDPAYNTGATCDYSVSNRPSLTVGVNLAAAFTPVSDLRSLAPTLVRSSTDSAISDPDTEIGSANLNDDFGKDWVFQSLPDETLNGVVPSGLQKAWFAESTAARDFSFKVSASNPTSAGCTSIMSSGTLTISGVAFSPSACTAGSGAYIVEFKRGNTTPTSSDVYAFNSFSGTTATLSLPGFQQVSLTISDSTVRNVPIKVSPAPAKMQSSFNFYRKPQLLAAKAMMAARKLL